jgi:flagellin
MGFAGAGADQTNDSLTALATYMSGTGDGITATVKGNEILLTQTSGTAPSTLFIAAPVGTDAIQAATPGLTMSGTPTPGAQFQSTVGSLAIGATGAYSDTLTAGKQLTIGSQTITIGAADNTLATLASTINAGAYGVTATYSQANKDIVFTSANSGIIIKDGSASGANPLADQTTGGATPVLTGQNTTLSSLGVAAEPGSQSTSSSAYYKVGISSTTGIVDYTTVVNTGTVNSPTLTYGGTGVYAAAGAVQANTGMVSDLSGSNGTATISYTDSAGQSLSATDLSNQADAQAALNSLNSAITDVAAQDGYIGAQINTLNAVSSVLSTQSENVTAAQNAVQATDYAAASSNMSKYEILSQTGISALAQANSVQQEVTKLLQ